MVTATGMATGPAIRERDRIYIDGEWVASLGQGVIAVHAAATEETVGHVPEGVPADVDRAVQAAAAALPTWARTAPADRAAVLRATSEQLKARTEEIAWLIATEVGMPLRMATAVQAGLPISTFAVTAAHAETFAFEERLGSSLVLRDPVGVVGAITPWNFPLHQLALKVAPALAAGCTVVAKPSEVAPFTAFLLAEVFEAVGLPKGVFNLVTGYGPVVGEALAGHPLVDMVSFTGSTRAGRRVAELAAAGVKRVALELGGKSASVILDDADLPAAVTASVRQALLNSGQRCDAWTRILVPRARQEEAVAAAIAAADGLPLGDPLGSGSRLGPLVSAAQRERVRAYIRQGVQEGARLVHGGPDAPEGLARGYYVRPTIFADVRNDMTIAQEEIFGPVLSILPYEDEADALRIANDTVYGLGGSVWSADPQRAERFARGLRTGQVDLNGAPLNPEAPFGGFKQSGIGREFARFGLEEYVEIKSIQGAPSAAGPA